jgi:hypothetical protein
MSTIYLDTIIKSDIQTVFDLARDIDLHQNQLLKQEKTFAGRTSGLIERRRNGNMESKTFRNLSNPDYKNYQHEEPYHFTDTMLKVLSNP